MNSVLITHPRLQKLDLPEIPFARVMQFTRSSGSNRLVLQQLILPWFSSDSIEEQMYYDKFTKEIHFELIDGKEGESSCSPRQLGGAINPTPLCAHSLFT